VVLITLFVYYTSTFEPETLANQSQYQKTWILA